MLIAGFPAGSFQANCYVLAAERGGECVIVDPGQDAVPQLTEVLAEHELRPAAVLLTHGHFDHTASVLQVCRSANVPAYLHDDDVFMLDDPLAGLSDQLRTALAGMPIGSVRPDSVQSLSAGPDRQLADLHVAGLTVSVDHVPGHTGGSVVFRIAADGDRPEVLLTGDTLFAGSIGRTDLPGGSTEQIMASLRDKLLTRPDTAVVLAGHGPTSTIGAERAGNPFLAGL